MNTLAKKTVLDTIRDTLEQNSQHAMAQAFSTRATGSQMHIEGDFGNGSQFKGTDLDDTVTITGNLVGNSPNKSTLIELLGGNDTVTVEGKIMASENGFLSIKADDHNSVGDKTINVKSGVENNGGYVEINIAGKGQHIINFKGDITTSSENGQSGHTNIYQSKDNSGNGQNSLNVDGSIIAKNESSNFYMDMGANSSKFFGWRQCCFRK